MKRIMSAYDISILATTTKTDEINKRMVQLLGDDLYYFNYDLDINRDMITGKFFIKDKLFGNEFDVVKLEPFNYSLEGLHFLKLYKIDVEKIFRDVNIGILASHFTEIFLNDMINNNDLLDIIYSNVKEFDKSGEIDDWDMSYLMRILTQDGIPRNTIIGFCENITKRKMIDDKPFITEMLINYISRGKCSLELCNATQYVYINLVNELTPIIFDAAKKDKVKVIEK